MTATIAAIEKAMAHPRQVARPVRREEGGVGGKGGGGGVLNLPRMPRIEVRRNGKNGQLRVSNQVDLVYTTLFVVQ